MPSTFADMKPADMILAHQQLTRIYADQSPLTPTRNVFGGWDYATQWGRIVRTVTDDTTDIHVYVFAQTKRGDIGPLISTARFSHMSPKTLAAFVTSLIEEN